MLGSDAELTAGRAEHKYLINGSQLGRVKGHLDQQLRRHVHADRGRLSHMLQHYTTTVYFDTPDRDLYRAAAESQDHVKLRAREYYEVMPLVELATDERDLLRSVPILWLELKSRHGHQSGKRRVGIPKRKLHGFFERPVADAHLREIQRRVHGDEGQEILDELVEFVASFPASLRPTCVVNYRRTAWQDAKATLRVTLDQELAAFIPEHAIWEREMPLHRNVLGRPLHLHKGGLLEIKLLDRPPPWIGQWLEDIDARVSPVSKFVSASAAVMSCE